MTPDHQTGYQQHALPSGWRMAYRDLGQGQAVVMVHGNPTWSYYYRHLFAQLVGQAGQSEGFRALVPDHIGMGHSDRWTDRHQRYTLAQRLDDPSAAIDLVVHDWGGAIGLSWAARHPDKIRRLVILNTWAFNIPQYGSLPWMLKFARSRLGQELIVRFNAFAKIAAKTAVSHRLDPETEAGFLAPYTGRPERRLATAEFVKDIPLSPDDPAWDVLAETEQRLSALANKPILIGWGMQDFVFGSQVLDIWGTIFPLAQVCRYDTAGHYVLEDAQDELIPTIVEFLGR
jgi:haloalkane dehalogenase